MNAKIDVTVARSAGIQNIYRFAAACAKLESLLSICGERGVGKEALARYIHSQSRFKHSDPVLYSLNNSPTKRIFAELHELAKLQTTVIIYDILASMEVQQVLYAMLSTFQGRLIILTQENCEEARLSGRLLPALYYRLHLLSIFIPPLRERPDDIQPFARLFLKEIAREHGLAHTALADDAETCLLQYAWPGNLDELRCVLERASLCSKGRVEKEELHLKIQDSTFDMYNDATLKVAVQDFKRHLLTERLVQNNWNQTKSARTLGIQRTYLIKLIKELSISKEYAI